MTIAVRRQTRVQANGAVQIDVPELTPGEPVEVIILADAPTRPFTAGDLLKSGLPGLWANREDIRDGSEYARQLRQEAEHRSNVNRDAP